MAYIKVANQQNLKKHIGTVHEGIKPFECSICDDKFANNVFPKNSYQGNYSFLNS